MFRVNRRLVEGSPPAMGTHPVLLLKESLCVLFHFLLTEGGEKSLKFLPEFFSLLESSGYASLFPFKPKEATCADLYAG